MIEPDVPGTTGCSGQSQGTGEAALDILHVADTVVLRHKLMQA